MAVLVSDLRGDALKWLEDPTAEFAEGEDGLEILSVNGVEVRYATKGELGYMTFNGEPLTGFWPEHDDSDIPEEYVGKDFVD